MDNNIIAGPQIVIYSEEIPFAVYVMPIRKSFAFFVEVVPCTVYLFPGVGYDIAVFIKAE